MSHSADLWPIFIVTLEGDDARRAPLLAALDDLNLPYELLMGVDGRSGLTPEWAAQIDREAATRNMNRVMTDGEFACALSHQVAYARILDHNLPGAVILEDDAIVLPEFTRFMHAHIYEKSDMVIIDHQSGWFAHQAAMELMPGVEGYQPLIAPLLTTGYTISAKGARYMRDQSFPIAATADWPCDILPLAPLAAYPRVIGNNNDTGGASHLSGDRVIVVKKRAKSALRYLTRAYWRTKWIKKTAKRLY